MKRIVFQLITLFFCHLSFSQDAKENFSIKALYRSMLDNHPVVKQAQLLSEQAKQEILIARGAGFDPKIQSIWDKKTFGGKDYYSIWQNSLKIPTWFGAEFKAGYDEVYGNYVNPERTIPTNGQSYIGVSLPVGQGLFIDSRRATLRLAQQSKNINDAEKIKIINKILYDAAKDYWEWYFKYFRYKNLEFGYNLAMERYSFVKSKVLIGEEAPIDSTEALILLQTRYVTFSAAQMEWQNATLMLSNHIWSSENTPLELDTTTIPQAIMLQSEAVSNEEFKALEEFATKKHPEILKLNYKIKQLDIERRLALESLKPGINLSYNLLQAGQNPIANYDSKYFQNNYKAGVDVSFPLLWRKERGKLSQTKAKIKSTEFERLFTSRQILNQLTTVFNELKNTEMLLIIQSRLVNNYLILRQGEYEKFTNGESSLFLVNSRETSLIEAQIKLAEMESKYQKAKAALYWSAGRTEVE